MCSNHEISCVRIKRLLVLEPKDFSGSKQEIPCARIKRFLVFESKDFLCSNQKIHGFESRDVLCSNQDISCVPTETFPRSQGGHVVVPKEDMCWRTVLADGTGPDGVEFWSYRPQNERI